MFFSRTFRSGLVLVSIFALAGAGLGGGCATQNGTSGSGTTSTGGGEAACYGTPPTCAGLDDFDCQTTAGCKHAGGCEGTAVACENLSANACLTQGGCTPMTFGNCSGQASQCFNIGNPGTCAQQVGCFWDQKGFFCNGNATACQQLPNQNCATQQGCTLNQAADCTGIPTACNTLMTDDTCAAALGCVWVSQCNGTAAACETFADADCAYQPGCACDSCGSSSSSSSSSGGPCTGLADCDPLNDPCRTGNCVNGECVKIPNCQPCVKQVECNPHKNACLTGNCIDGMCQPIADCQTCTTPNDCTAAVNKCFSGNCVDGTCEIKTVCTSGDGCCPAGCSGKDSDCP